MNTLAVAALLLLLSLSGCTGLEPAAVGAGVSAAQSGGAFLSRGKAGSYELATFEESLEAARRAGDTCGFQLDRERPTPHGLVLVYYDDRAQRISVTVERRTESVTLIRANTGPLGPTGLASLYFKQVLEVLDSIRPSGGSPD